MNMICWHLLRHCYPLTSDSTRELAIPGVVASDAKVDDLDDEEAAKVPPPKGCCTIM